VIDTFFSEYEDSIDRWIYIIYTIYIVNRIIFYIYMYICILAEIVTNLAIMDFETKIPAGQEDVTVGKVYYF
jgi:hypothetical protein